MSAQANTPGPDPWSADGFLVPKRYEFTIQDLRGRTEIPRTLRETLDRAKAEGFIEECLEFPGSAEE